MKMILYVLILVLLVYISSLGIEGFSNIDDCLSMKYYGSNPSSTVPINNRRSYKVRQIK